MTEPARRTETEPPALRTPRPPGTTRERAPTRDRRRRHARSDSRARRRRQRRRLEVLLFGALTALCALALAAALLGTSPRGEPVRAVAPPTVRPPEEFPAAAAGFDAAELRSRLESVAAAHAGVYGVVVHYPASGQTVGINADRPFYAASLAKLPALYSLYRAAAGGELGLDEPIAILPADVQTYGSGVLYQFPLYAAISLRACGEYLIRESDNTAWVMLERRLGAERIQADLEAVGAAHTDYASRATTPADVLAVLEAISDPSRTSGALSAQMLGFMTDTAYEDRIPAALPPGVSVAHKVGSYGDTFGDAGIVRYRDRSGQKRTYYIVVIAEGTTEADATAAIREMTAATHAVLAAPGAGEGQEAAN